VIKKIVAGKMNKWYEEIVLLDQTFALADDPSEAVKIGKLIDLEAVKMGFKANDVVLDHSSSCWCSCVWCA
jgi:translation elongation factor EF-Ts